MKLIFLDIDGVLNSERYIHDEHARTGKCMGGSVVEMIDLSALRELERICVETGARIVVSSCWRIGRTVEELRKIFDDATFSMPERIIDRTPAPHYGITRGKEIAKWFEEIRIIPDSFIILDDDPDMKPYRAHLVKTNWKTGLTPAIADRAIAQLNEQKTL